jgi:hypothetical protein
VGFGEPIDGVFLELFPLPFLALLFSSRLDSSGAWARDAKSLMDRQPADIVSAHAVTHISLDSVIEMLVLIKNLHHERQLDNRRFER